MSSTVKDLTAGTAGGIAQVRAASHCERVLLLTRGVTSAQQVLVGQPFDIVKVRMQTAPAGTYSGMLHCAGGILKNEGPLAFYKVWCALTLPAITACLSIPPHSRAR
ncbi:hypothetical protein NUW54_g13366 [Trametes sanguinea]|uniref:Uncharacterized protein n=1 Tax=Trametes sanguinea TaxID=158606 RepID=A0ACC1MLR4_9APHY|nr:hypothetical protein NUW54_g13366 [Trametes sanguinea]